MEIQEVMLSLESECLCELMVVESSPEPIGTAPCFANISMSIPSEVPSLSVSDTVDMSLAAIDCRDSAEIDIGDTRFFFLLLLRSSLCSSRWLRPRRPKTESLMHHKKNKQWRTLTSISSCMTEIRFCRLDSQDEIE